MNRKSSPAQDTVFLRQQMRDHLVSTPERFDVVIIGGGITGAGIALDAASRGLKTLLLEKKDFASGTSSRSTKLIHGGLRYLRQMQFHVVAETGRERAIVHGLAPHLVIPEKMLLPILRGGSMGRTMIALGLTLYDLLAGVRKEDRKRMLSREETLQKVPLLPRERVKGGGYYAEYMTDDARLTLEVIKTAMRHGAWCLNYTEVTRLTYDKQNKVNGVEAQDGLSEERFTVQAKHVVNAAGPWVDEVREMDHSLTGKHLFITKGVHLVFDREKLPLNHPIYFDLPDGRMMFLLPRHGIVYAGTTDTPYTGDKHDPPVTHEDVTYLLDGIRHLFPRVDLGVTDVLSSWAGLRPLIYQEGKSASEISRKDEIFISPTGLISMAGGKLTGYRRMAEKVVDRILRREGRKVRCRTKHIPLTDDPFRDLDEITAFREEMVHLYPGISAREADEMVMKYGRDAQHILSRAKEEDQSLILAEAEHAIDKEMTFHPLDFLERRSGRMLFDLPNVKKELPSLLALFARRFGWNPERIAKEKRTVEQGIKMRTPPFPPATESASRS